MYFPSALWAPNARPERLPEAGAPRTPEAASTPVACECGPVWRWPTTRLLGSTLSLALTLGGGKQRHNAEPFLKKRSQSMRGDTLTFSVDQQGMAPAHDTERLTCCKIPH